jgi:hypothetical protein
VSTYRAPCNYRFPKTYRGAELVPAVPPPGFGTPVTARWVLPAPRGRTLRAPSPQAEGLQQALTARFDAATPQADSTALPWGTPEARGEAVGLPYGAQTPQADTTAAPFAQASAVDATTAAPWSTATPQADTAAAPWRQAAAIDRVLASRWGTAERVDQLLTAFWRQAAARGAVIALPWGPAGQRQTGVGTPWPTDPVTGTTLQPILREAYIMIPTLSAVVLPGRTPLNVLSLRLATDVDSYGWQGSAQIPFAELGAVRPGDELVEVEVTVNGYTWVLAVDDYSDNRRFGARTATINLRSRSALLDAPYAPARTGLAEDALTANQLGDEQLFGTGWTLLWDAVDWLVPGGRWSWQDATALQALSELAAAIGAGIETDRTTLDLRVRPRYPVSPWAWGAATPYAVIPAHIITALSGQAPRGPNANGCYVFDGAGAGALVRITGTGGEVQTVQVVDRLLSEADAQRERGRIEIARGGRISTHSVQTLLLPSPEAPGLIPLRSLLQITEPLDPNDPGAPAVSWRGQCMAVSIDADRAGGPASVRQTLTVERHHRE